MTDLNALQKDIVNLRHILMSEPLRILIDGANQIVNFAQSIVRVDTGTLRSDIRVEVRQSTATITSVAVAAGGTQTNPKTGLICNYAQIIERKYPYLAPAMELVRPQITANLEALHK